VSGRHLARVLAVLLSPSPAILLIVVAVIAWAAYLTIVEPEDLRGPYIVLLLCQSFAASTGFATRARRGHFDQLLAGRTDRWRFALTHVWSSIAFGGLAWVAISAMDALGAGGHWPLGFTPRAVVAFLYVSAIAWGLSVPFSRYAIGLVWLIATVALAASGRLVGLRNTYANADHTLAGMWQSTGAALIFPPLLVSEPFSPSSLLMLIVLLAAVASAFAGVAVVSLSSLQLEDLE